jgi:large repetitive protein
VTAVDSQDVESLGRTITLPAVRATLDSDAVVRRGLMNRLTYSVENRSGQAMSGVRLKVDLDGRGHYSDSFDLAAGDNTSVGVVVGGYDDLTDPANITTTVEISPGINEKVRIVRQGQVRVGEGMLVLQILNEEFTRGGTGKVWFTLENTGDEAVEILTARNSGNSDSNQIRFKLLDEDGNVIAAKAFRQAVGNSVVTLSDKTVVARIGAGETFTSQPIEIDVPSTAPDNLTVRFAIDAVY